MTGSTCRLGSTAVAVALALFNPTGRLAAAEPDDSALSEVVVTAQKREQNLQDVGISVAAFDGESLRDRGVTSSTSLGAITPGLVVNDYGNPVITVFTLRGVSQFDFGDHQEAPVAVFVDGSYIPYLSGVGMNFFDLDRVEVERGPQGTLFGRNATGGVISLVSAKPTRDLDGFAELRVGNFGAVRAEGAIGGPLGENLRGRLSVLKDEHDGYFKNALGRDKGDADNTSWRAQLAGDIGEQGSFNLTVRGSRDRTTSSPYEARSAYVDPDTGAVLSGDDQAHVDFCAGFFGAVVAPNTVDCLSGDASSGDPYKIRHNRIGSFRRDYYGATAAIDWDLGAATLASVSSYGHLKKRYDNEDSDGTSLDTLFFGQSVDAEDFSQELRLSGSSERFNWLTGAYYLHIDGNYGTQTGFFPFDPTLTAEVVNGYDLTTRSWAVFAQSELALSPRLTLTTGARWTEDRKKFSLGTNCSGVGCGPFGLTDPFFVQGTGYDSSVPGARPTRSSGNWDAKVQLGFRPREDLLLYAGVARGTKAGGFNGGATAFYTVDQVRFDDEELTSYEAGLKSQFAEGRIRLNSSIWYYDYANVQVFSQLGPSTVTFNRDAKAHGGELELTARVSRGFDLGFGVSVLKTRIDPIDVLNVLTGEITQQKQEMINAPGATVNIVARKEWPLGRATVSAQADATWTDHRKLNLIDNPATREPSYTLANLRFGYAADHDRWDVGLYCQNVTDKEYRLVATPFVNFTGAVLELYGVPRTYGASVRMRF